MSNAERQRRFRARHRGYFRKYDARLRAMRIAAHEKSAALWQELAKAKWAALQEQPATPLMLLPTLPLMLPAPVQDPTMAALDALAESLASKSVREPLPLSASAPRPADRRSRPDAERRLRTDPDRTIDRGVKPWHPAPR